MAIPTIPVATPVTSSSKTPRNDVKDWSANPEAVALGHADIAYSFVAEQQCRGQQQYGR